MFRGFVVLCNVMFLIISGQESLVANAQTITCTTSVLGFYRDLPLPGVKARESLIRSEVDRTGQNRALQPCKLQDFILLFLLLLNTGIVIKTVIPMPFFAPQKPLEKAQALRRIRKFASVAGNIL